jgi:hypothetical protein
MKRGRLNTKGAEQANPADTENDFLADTVISVAALTPRRGLPVGGSVLFNLGVHQIERQSAEIDPPNLDENMQGSDLELHEQTILTGWP